MTLSLRPAWLLAGLLAFTSNAHAQHQTDSFSPVSVGSVLPYQVQLAETSLGTAELPTLQSYAAAEHDGKWVLVAGRTNGLHGFSQIPTENFPEAYRSYDVWVVDPAAGQSWRRSLHPDDNENSGLTANQAISIGTTNNQFVKLNDTLYLTGGYSGDDTIGALTALDLPGIVDWVQNGTGMASNHIRQVEDPYFRVTGGAMYELDGKVQLVFGHDFPGRYRPGKNGIYTQSIKSFEINDDGTTLSFSNATSTTPVDEYRRRDLNVYPVLSPDGLGGHTEGLTALSGVFTESDGVWTVPVEIDEYGAPSMADPELAGTFKQSMNQYHSAKFGMYSASTGAMHEVLMGGITINQYDWGTGMFVQDNAAPNTSQVTSVVVDADGNYSQHLLGAFPVILDEHDYYLRLGANGEFFVAHGIPTFDNGVIDFDELPAGETVIGHVFGGLAANADHIRNNPDPYAASIASDMVFEVTVSILEGDFNRDGYVNLADYTVWRNTLGASVTYGTHADASGNGVVDAADYTIWKSNFGLANTQPVALPVAALQVPEPATWLLSALSIVCLGASHLAPRPAICRE
ncbi:dockerin type I domain-containing protein [Aeoliella sp.]|uniref:dockerin type I domain-containing protein n=1 Tax=Aeoliella sp. TaxID=2795800 RepID=UPI003CCB7C85